jgi:hypothetical protein
MWRPAKDDFLSGFLVGVTAGTSQAAVDCGAKCQTNEFVKQLEDGVRWLNVDMYVARASCRFVCDFFC